jgi:SAM-dependent methyltransferase
MLRIDAFSDPDYLAFYKRLCAQDVALLSENLGHWSRRWGFPFFAHTIFHWMAKNGNKVNILESGSGVTGMPFWFARLGADVTGVDLDPSCVPRWEEEAKRTGVSSEFKLQDMEALQFPGDSFDVVYAISAIEHTENPDKAVAELCRVLCPGGLLVLSCDVEPQGGIGIPHAKFQSLLDVLDQNTEFVYPPTWSHPSEIVTSNSYPFNSTGIKLRRRISAVASAVRNSSGPSNMAIYATARRKVQAAITP